MSLLEGQRSEYTVTAYFNSRWEWMNEFLKNSEESDLE